MIVRTYSRRARDIGRGFSDSAPLDDDFIDSQEFDDLGLSQESAHDRFSFAFSSQDSSPWSQDPGPAPFRRPGMRPSSSKARDVTGEGIAGPSVSATATLMEAQEFGEMMEHVDEVNFALDGLRPGQPARIRRASLLSLLSICATPQQRRLLRTQGMAKRIIDAILILNFDDSMSNLTAATLFFVLTTDFQDDQLLDSAPCIRFLLKLLKPPVTGTFGGRTSTIGSKLLSIRNPQVLSVTDKGMDSSSRTISSKVEEILLSCKEIKSAAGDVEGRSRPELSAKWISLLTMEKACLSAVSFEDTSETVTKARGKFKERLRELGGLDTIFDVIISCYSTMETWLKWGSPSVSELNDGANLESVSLLLKCLKILENATFLSKDNQDHLLGMRGKISSERLSTSFIGVVVKSIKTLSGLALLQSPLNHSNKGKSSCPLENAGSHSSHDSEVEANGKRKGSDASDGVDGCRKKNKTCQEGKLSTSSKLSDSPSEIIDRYLNSIKKAECNELDMYDGTKGDLNGGSHENSTGSKLKVSTNGLRIVTTSSGLKKDSDNSGKQSHGWISLRPASKADSSRQSRKSHISDIDPDESTIDTSDPFAFDDGEFEPSKWEKLARNTVQTLRSTSTNKELGKGDDGKGDDVFSIDKELGNGSDGNTVQTLRSTSTSKELGKGIDGKGNDVFSIDKELGKGNDGKGNDVISIDTQPMLSQSASGDCHRNQGDDCTSATHEDSNILEDCLLASVKVLMNLTNDNPDGCQQIGAFGGLDTMVSLIINHFPSFDMSTPMHSRLKEDTTSSSPSTSSSYSNKKHLTDHALDFLVAILGLLVNLVEKDSKNRSRLASARVLVEGPGRSKNEEYGDVISLLCSIFLANQGAGEAAGEGRLLLCDEEALTQGEQEAEMMILEAYAALLLAFLSTESSEVRDAIASYLPNHNLEALVPVLERFVAFHLQLNMISPETHSSVMQVIESCKRLQVQ